MSEPVRARAACGRTRPTKPIAPAALTRAAVSRAVVHSGTIRVRATFTPSAAAASARRRRRRAYGRGPGRSPGRRRGRRAAQRLAPADTAERAEEPEQDPAGLLGVGGGHHDERGEGGEELHRGDAGEDGRSVEPPRVWLSSSTRAKERSAPTNAPADSDTAPHRPRGRPRRPPRWARAPEETPGRRGRRAGCAAGLHHRAAHREPGAAHGGEEGARHAEVPDDAVPDRAEVARAEAEVRGDGGPDVGNGESGRARSSRRPRRRPGGAAGRCSRAARRAARRPGGAGGDSRQGLPPSRRYGCRWSPRRAKSRSPAATRSQSLDGPDGGVQRPGR